MAFVNLKFSSMTWCPMHLFSCSYHDISLLPESMWLLYHLPFWLLQSLYLVLYLSNCFLFWQSSKHYDDNYLQTSTFVFMTSVCHFSIFQTGHHHHPLSSFSIVQNKCCVVVADLFCLGSWRDDAALSLPGANKSELNWCWKEIPV